MQSLIILLVFLSYGAISEDCSLVSSASSSATEQYLNGALGIGMNLFESAGPFETVVGGFLGLMGANSAFSTSGVVMQCTSNIYQEINEQFRSSIDANMQAYTKGFDLELYDYYTAWRTCNSINNCPTALAGESGAIYLYLIPLNSAMITNSAFFFPDNSQNLGYPLVVLPYLANYMSLRAMVYTDLFVWSARNAGGTPAQNINVAFSLYANQLYNEVENAITYNMTWYTQSQLNLRTSQISCSAGGAECCGSGISSSCCGCVGGCGEGNYCWDAVFNVADTWRPDWTYPGYPHQENCFFNPDYCPANSLCMGAPSGWVTADNACNAAATAEINQIMSDMLSAVSNYNTALITGENVYNWMCNVAGQVPQKFGCFTGDDLVQLESGDIVSFKELEIGDKIATYIASNESIVYSEIGFFAVYYQLDPVLYMDFVVICFDSDSIDKRNLEQTNSSFDGDNSTSGNSTSSNPPPRGNLLPRNYATPIGANCVKLTTNHAVKLANGSYVRALNVTAGDVVWPNSLVSNVSIVRDTGQVLVVPLPWDSPFIVLSNGIILPVFGYYGGTPPEIQEVTYGHLIAQAQELCNADNDTCNELREIYEGISVLASTYYEQTFNVPANETGSIKTSQLFDLAKLHRESLQNATNYINKHKEDLQNYTQATIDEYLAKFNISYVNGTYVYEGGNTNIGGDDSSNIDAGSSADDISPDTTPEIIGISVAVVIIFILVVIGIVYFIKLRKTSIEVGYQQYIS